LGSCCKAAAGDSKITGIQHQWMSFQLNPTEATSKNWVHFPMHIPTTEKKIKTHPKGVPCVSNKGKGVKQPDSATYTGVFRTVPHKIILKRVWWVHTFIVLK
jgi:hypothetical protein